MPVKYPLFRRLEFQVSLLTALCVVATLLLFGFYVADREAERARSNTTRLAKDMAEEIASLSANHLALRDYAGLEKNLVVISYKILPMMDIMVTDANGHVLSQVEQMDEDVKPRFQYLQLETPAERKPVLEVQGDVINAWHPVDLGHVHCWVRLRFTLARVAALKQEIFTHIIFVALLAASLCALLLITFLSPRLRALKSVTAFATRLDTHLGDQIKLPRSSVEVDTLATVLNQASRTIADNERSLRASESRLRSVVENMPVLLIAFDRKGEIIIWNRECERVTGYSAAEVVEGGRFSQLMKREICEQKPQKGYQQAGHYFRGQELGIHSRSGETRTISWTDISDQFPIPGWASWRIGVDVTEKVESERIKNDFISTVNHELRTPLTSIRGSLNLLSAGVAGTLPATAQDMVRIAERNSERLLRLVTDILDIQRMEAGEFLLVKRPVDINRLAQETIQANEPFAHQRNVTLTLQTPDNSVNVLCDGDRLEQVITNFISNAVKHSVAGETVQTVIRQYQGQVRIEVRDKGPGIPPEFRDKIFERFARADSSASSKSGGSGLGLFISRAIVEQHGGKIGFESSPEEGTIFYFEVPALAKAMSA